MRKSFLRVAIVAFFAGSARLASQVTYAFCNVLVIKKEKEPFYRRKDFVPIDMSALKPPTQMLSVPIEVSVARNGGGLNHIPPGNQPGGYQPPKRKRGRKT